MFISLLSGPRAFFSLEILCIPFQRERERGKHRGVVASSTSPTGDLAATQANALTGNRTSDPLVRRPGTQSSETPQPGLELS